MPFICHRRMPIVIFKGDDTDALGYQTIVATIRTSLDLAGCSAVFSYMDFVQTFDAIPEDRRLVIRMSSNDTKCFAPGNGYATIKITDSEGKIRTFDNKIPVFVSVYTPSACGGEIEIEFNAVPQLLFNDSFDMLSTDWELRELVVKVAKLFGLTVTNDTPPENDNE